MTRSENMPELAELLDPEIWASPGWLSLDEVRDQTGVRPRQDRQNDDYERDDI